MADTRNMYYVSNSQGNDSNDGKSKRTSWKTLKRAGEQTYYPGDQILLKCGDIWNEQLIITDSSGTPRRPIRLSSYGQGPKPAIRRNQGLREKCMVFHDVGGWKIQNLDIGNTGGLGILFHYNNTYEHEYLWVENCHFHDIYGIDQTHPVEGEHYQFSAGIGIGGDAVEEKTDSYFIKNIKLKGNTSYYCGSMLVTVGSAKTGYTCAKRNLMIEDCIAEYNTIYGVVVSENRGGWIKNCKFLFNGTHSMPYGTAGIMLGNLFNYQVVDTEVAYQQRTGVDPDGCGIDFEVNCYDVQVRNCLIHHNAGVGVMMFGPNGSVNKRCTVEACIFQCNNQNPFNPSGFEVYFSAPDRNNDGKIRNNIYDSMDGVRFINECDPSVTVEKNHERSFVDRSEKESKDVYQASADFSIVQGKNRWFYQGGNGDSYFPLTWDFSKGRYYDPEHPASKEYYDPEHPGCFVARKYQHPQEYDSVRTWVAPDSGTVLISSHGRIRLAQDGGDGTIVTVQKNSQTVWGPKHISTREGEDFLALELQIEADDALHFIVNKNSSYQSDLTFWDPIILYKEKTDEENMYI